jgi:tetratricopeptide (TPR) repeat protein
MRFYDRNAILEHVPREKKPEKPEETVDWKQRAFVHEHPDGSVSTYLPTEVVDGERVMSIEIPTVVVKARAKTLTERLGKVNIDFIITLPKNMQGHSHGITITPYLHNKGTGKALEELSIRGDLFSKVQVRNYWQLERYKELFKPDSVGALRAYERFIRFPHPISFRLDSIINHRETITYHYRQEVSSRDIDKRIMITMKGKIEALDHSFYDFPMSDTLFYNISSMLTFVDTTTRYMKKIIEKYVVVNDRNYLNFKLGSAVIIDTLGNNKEQLEKIETLMSTLLHQNEFYVDSITLTATASPDGSVRVNERMSKERAYSLRDYLINRLKNKGVAELITVRWIGEDWDELVKLLKNTWEIKNRNKILEMIAGMKDQDVTEAEIKSKFPQDYKYMLDKLYPKLRAVDFKYNLRRVGMVQDTITTTVPDTTYARGIELLQMRKYTDALEILDTYKDQNTAIVLLSLGYDKTALEILSTLPSTAVVEYLKAIACSRLGNKTGALEHFREACLLDDNMEYRGELDPEISELLK